VRLSAWCFGSPFLGSSFGGVTLDDTTLKAVKDARIDDVSMVNTLVSPDDNWILNGNTVTVRGTIVRWSDAFRPGGIPKNDPTLDPTRESYLKQLVTKLHDPGFGGRKVQLILGYTIGNKGKEPQPPPAPPADASEEVKDKFAKDFAQFTKDHADWVEVETFCKGWAAWLKALTAQQVRDHALALASTVNILGADGLGFDIENTFMGAGRVANLDLLYKETADAMVPLNGIVYFANGPFTVDGVQCASHKANVAVLTHMQCQPYGMAAGIPNLMARPMCYDTFAYDFKPGLVDSITCALSTASGGGGLDPSQVQFGIDVGTASLSETLDFCTNNLRPNRIGFVVYQISQDNNAAQSTLKKCIDIEKALNDGEAPPGTPGQPAQMPT
jgi:hypothetical protein